MRGRAQAPLVNKRDRATEVKLPPPVARIAVVDQATKGAPIDSAKASGDRVKLGGLAVAVVTFDK